MNDGDVAYSVFGNKDDATQRHSTSSKTPDELIGNHRGHKHHHHHPQEEDGFYDGDNYDTTYHPWRFNKYYCCFGFWNFLILVGGILGIIGFGVALANGSAINTLETNQAALTTTQNAQQTVINAQTIPFSHTSAGPLQPLTETQYIEVAAVAAMTMPIDLTPYLNNKICVISKSAFAHTITLGAGATWNGADTIATFGGAVGDGLCFTVISLTTMFVMGTPVNVAFS